MRVVLRNIDVHVSVDADGKTTFLVTTPHMAVSRHPDRNVLASVVFPEAEITPQRLGAELSDLLRYTVVDKLAELQSTPPVEGHSDGELEK